MQRLVPHFDAERMSKVGCLEKSQIKNECHKFLQVLFLITPHCLKTHLSQLLFKDNFLFDMYVHDGNARLFLKLRSEKHRVNVSSRSFLYFNARSFFPHSIFLTKSRRKARTQGCSTKDAELQFQSIITKMTWEKLQHRLQIFRHFKEASSGFHNILHIHTVSDFRENKSPLLVDSEYPEFGDDEVHASFTGEGQRAFLQNLVFSALQREVLASMPDEYENSPLAKEEQINNQFVIK